MNTPGTEEGIIIETCLSKKPAEGSGLVAVTGFIVMLGFSLLYWADYSGVASYLPASGEQVFEQGQYWRLCTSIFIHADWKHLLSNSLGIVGLGYLLFGYFGYRVFPCLSFVTGVIVTLIALRTYPPHISLLGASGVVYLMSGFWLTLYVCLERRFSPGKRIFRACGVLLVVLLPTNYSPDISYRTHAIGFIVGVVLAILYFFPNKARFRSEEVVAEDWE